MYGQNPQQTQAISQMVEQTVANLKELESRLDIFKSGLANLAQSVGNPQAAQVALTPASQLRQESQLFSPFQQSVGLGTLQATPQFGQPTGIPSTGQIPGQFAGPTGSPQPIRTPQQVPYIASPSGPVGHAGFPALTTHAGFGQAPVSQPVDPRVGSGFPSMGVQQPPIYW